MRRRLEGSGRRLYRNLLPRNRTRLRVDHRRDLRGLRDRGLLERVYGGALPVRSTEGDFATRSTLHATSKLAIAQLAATLVEPEDTIVIDIGTTALEVARALPEAFRGRVLTNSVPAAMALADRDEIELLLCGGQVRQGDAACFGAQAEAFFADFYADKAFLGSGGVHAQAGLTDYHPPEVATRRTIIAHAAASYVLADSSKLGAIAVHRVCPLSRVTAVLTDPDATAEVTEALTSAGCTVLDKPPRADWRLTWTRSPREPSPRTSNWTGSATASSSPARSATSSRSRWRSRSSRSPPASSPPTPSR